MSIECAICIDSLEQELVVTACGHIFHQTCIESYWSTRGVQRGFCPACRENSTFKPDSFHVRIYPSVVNPEIKSLTKGLETVKEEVTNMGKATSQIKNDLTACHADKLRKEIELITSEAEKVTKTIACMNEEYQRRLRSKEMGIQCDRPSAEDPPNWATWLVVAAPLLLVIPFLFLHSS